MINSKWRMTSSLYLNYFLLGMVNIIIASHMSFLSEQLNTDNAGISSLISAIGIGKLITLSLSGRLSDRFGRKPLVVISSFLYPIFLIGIPLAPSYSMAFMFAVIAGISNAIMDSGTYPALSDGFPKRAGSVTVLLKAFISIGAIVLPIMITFFITHDLFYGYTFFIIAIIYLINGLQLLFVTFHKQEANNDDVYQGNEGNNNNPTMFSIQPRFWREGIGVILIGFSSVALFMIIQVWLPTYGQEVVGLSKIEAVGLLSFYSIGGFLSVLMLAFFLNKLIKPITALIVYPSIAFLALLILLLIPSPLVIVSMSFLLGLSTSGLFQLAVILMMEFFPEKKGTSSAYVSLASSIAFIIIPFVTGLITKHTSVVSVFIFDMAIAILCILLALNILNRYKKVFNIC